MSLSKLTLPVLAPCDQDFRAMPRDGDGRRCAACATTVFDLSSMTELAARRLLARATGPLCVRYRVDRDGELRFRPAPPRAGAARFALGVGLASLLGAAAPAFADNSIPPTGGADSGEHPAPAPSHPTQPPGAAPARPDRQPPGDRVRPRKPPMEDYVMGKILPPKF